ncbi:MAG: hypothetical protein ACI4UJ_05565 [Candidatus Cryptobacteroides sp.]
MIIDFLTQNYEWLHPLVLCFVYAVFLVFLFILPKVSPLLALRSELQDNLYYVQFILDNPPTGGNSRIENILDYAQYLSGQDFSTRGARSPIVTGCVFSPAMAAQAVFLLTVSDSVEELPFFTDAVLSIILSIVFLMLAVFPLAISRSNRRNAAKLRQAAGKAMNDYYMMLSDSLPQPGEVDDTEMDDENEMEKDKRG